MFTIGLPMCIPVYTLAITGINISILSRNIFDWSPLPVLLAFIFILLYDKFTLNPSKITKIFLLGTALTIGLFFVPLPISSTPLLITGLIFANILAILQLAKKFDISSMLLFLAIPCFAVCFAAIGLNLIELAIFAGFAAKTSLILAFEAAKKQEGSGTSLLVLKKQLNTAEQNFSKLFGILPDPAVIVDGKGTFLAITERVTALSGFQREELIGTNFMKTDLITAGSKAILVKNLTKRMLGFDVKPYQIELRAKDGMLKQFELNAMKIDFQGKPADMVILRDFTERNKLTRSLEQEQERFQSVAESSGEWIWEVDSEGKYVFSNPCIDKILGYSAEEIIGMKCCDLICQSEREEKKKLFKDCENKKKQICITKNCLHKDGQTIILESHIALKYTADGRFAGFRGVDRDITERKKAEAEISNSKKYFETILYSLLSGIVIIDAKTHEIIDVNPAALTMMRSTREEVIGKVCHNFLCPVENGKCPITDLGLTVDRSEKILLTNNGSRISILKSIGKVESNGRSLLIENFVDISDRKQMAAKLLKSERLAAIGELATMVAHDLRNPLQAISATTHFLKKATIQKRNEKMNFIIQRIDDSIKYSDEIIRDLLDYSANLKLDYGNADPHSVVHEALCGIEIPARIEVIDITQEKPKFQVDLERIRRVIVNLVMNAIEAMPAGGTLTIASQEKQDRVELSFADTGIGISKEKMNRLWTPFVTTKAKGLGLGLPICKRIIEAHEGEINVETENGKGTTFTITIPINTLRDENVEFSIRESLPIFSQTHPKSKGYEQG